MRLSHLILSGVAALPAFAAAQPVASADRIGQVQARNWHEHTTTTGTKTTSNDPARRTSQ